MIFVNELKGLYCRFPLFDDDSRAHSCLSVVSVLGFPILAVGGFSSDHSQYASSYVHVMSRLIRASDA